MPNIPEEWGNNFYKSGWQPGLEVNEQTGLGEITHVGTDPNYRNKLDSISKQYQKYLENFVRRSLNLKGVPMKLILKKTENPFKHKKNVLTDRQIAKRKRIRNR